MQKEEKEALEQELDAVIEPKLTEAEKKLAKIIEKRFTPGDEDKDTDTTSKFKSLGEQLVAVKNFAVSEGQIIDPRLKAPAGLSEGVPSEGGFLVQTDFATELLEKAYATSDILSRVTKFPLGANFTGRKVPAVDESSRADGSRQGGVRAYWLNEAGTKTESRPTFSQISLEVKKLIGLCYVTDELLQDAPFLEAWIRMAFIKEFDFKIVDAIINGDGASKPLGILNSPCLVTQDAETGQGATTIVAKNIIKMWARRYGPNTANYVWLINQDIEPQLHQLNIASGTAGMLVYMPAGGLSGAPYATLYGKPVIPCEQCATLGTAGDIILADLSQYFMIDKGDMQSASSIHVKFTTDETAFRFVYRVDGQPWWKSALTPYKGSSTQSPFVVLHSTRT